MDNTLLVFIAITAAVVLQAIFLGVLAFSVRKLAARVQTVTSQVESKLFPLLEDVKPLVANVQVLQKDAKQFLETAQPKLDVILDNVAIVTTTARSGATRLDATLNDVLDRARLQVIRADEMVTRTMDRVEETGERVQHTVMSPVRQLSGVLQGLSVGFGTFFGQRRSKNGGPQDEMFI